jgi:PAS domain S-box-containing protein
MRIALPLILEQSKGYCTSEIMNVKELRLRLFGSEREEKDRIRRIPHHKYGHDRRVLIMALASGLPAIITAMYFLWAGSYTTKAQWTLTVLIVGFWLGFSIAIREKVVYPLQTLSNLLAALREGDFSIRARGARHDDPLGEALMEVNSLGQTLREQRLGALEATALLQTVMAEIDVAIFAFDTDQKLVLVNRAGERLLGQIEERMIGRSAAELDLDDYLEGEATRTIQKNFPGGSSRWEIRRTTFRERGAPHHLLVVSDLSRALREEERIAWQRLVRVLGHELNNSLAPIRSLAGSLESIISREPLPEDWKDDCLKGLSVIAARSAALSRFMQGYARLAKLPPPKLQPVDLGEIIGRVAQLETRMSVGIVEGPKVTIRADSDQLEQLLINIIRNGVDASLETGGRTEISWSRNRAHVEVRVEDEGHGLSNTSNLFVPFFTTKQGGSGIGLVLCRQIAEAHGGSLSLENRKGTPGCRASLRLPL